MFVNSSDGLRSQELSFNNNVLGVQRQDVSEHLCHLVEAWSFFANKYEYQTLLSENNQMLIIKLRIQLNYLIYVKNGYNIIGPNI